MSNTSTSSDPPAVSATASSLSGAPPSPLDISRTPSSPSTTISLNDQAQPTTPARDLSLPALSGEQDLLGLGDYEVTIEDDEDTAPSSGDDSHPINNIVISSSDVEEEDSIYGDAKGFRPIIYSYLLKLGRNEKWQRRFFECDGASLTYFKTERRMKKLATLDLAKVGSIAVSTEDSSGCTFHIQVADRPYSLKAESSSSCVDWVITLNRTKEARLQVGRVKLVSPQYAQDAVDSKDAPRVLLQANRPRTRHFQDAEQWQQIIATGTANTANSSNSSPARQSSRIAFDSLTITARENMAVWEKAPGLRLQRMKYKFLQWARSVKKAAADVKQAAQDCRTPAEDVVISSDQPAIIKEKDIPNVASYDSNPAKLIPFDEDGEARELS